VPAVTGHRAARAGAAGWARVRLLPTVVALFAVVALAGCGVTVEDAPRPVAAPPGPLPHLSSAPPPSVESGTVAEVLYFVRGDRLVPVVRRVPATPSIDEQLRQLTAGPTQEERGNDLGSVLTGTTGIAGTRRSGSGVVVELGRSGGEAARSDEVLAFGQVVCTLTARSDVSGVSFVRGGQPLTVPRADGSLAQGPLTATDYASLTAPA